ncbi:hypothetical protein [Niabella sp.]|nr:hypothetical protein [Niabella sp.]
MAQITEAEIPKASQLIFDRMLQNYKKRNIVANICTTITGINVFGH